jgi:hypothetical protein
MLLQFVWADPLICDKELQDRSSARLKVFSAA